MRYAVLVFLCLIAIIAYIQRTGLNSAKGPICDDIGINTEEFGALGSSLLFGYALMQVPAGWLADRFGGRSVLVVLAIAWSILTGLLGAYDDFHIMLGLWFLMGMAQAGVFPCAAKSIGAWFEDREKATASGFLGSSTMLGLAAGSALTVRLVFQQGLSWQWTYALYGVAGVAWAAAYFLVIPERHAVRDHVAMSRGDWVRLATSVPLWLLCGQQFFRAGAMIFFINWFPAFLKEARGFTEADAGDNAGLVGLAALTGGILGGFFSDSLFRLTGMRRLSRQGIAVAGMSGACLLVLLANEVADAIGAVWLFAAAAFIASFGGVSGYTVAIEFGGKRVGIVFSMMNMAGNFSAAFVTYLAGALKQRTGSWDAALFLIAGIFAVDAICWALLNPKGPLFADDRSAGGSPAPEEIGFRAGEPPALRKDEHEPR
jgi:sugar phosphate permease